MKRLKDAYLDSIEEVLPLFGKSVLEIGCGNGSRSVEIAKRSAYLTAMEPDIESLNFARTHNVAQNITYVPGKAERLGFKDEEFDIVLFTLSLHHVSIEEMPKAIDEAIRVTKKGGNIVFLEPTEEGTFFDAEIAFEACDGDERVEKRAAYNALKNHPGYEEIVEMPDETIFHFDSVDDFITTMAPKKAASEIKEFLERNDYILRAARRINVFRV